VSAPATIQAIVSGITVSVGCIISSGFALGQVVSGSFTNGTYCLTPDTSVAGTCQYTATLPHPVVVERAPAFATDCLGAPGATDTLDTLRVIMTNTGKVIITIGTYDTSSSAVLFASEVSANPNCVDGTYNNEVAEGQVVTGKYSRFAVYGFASTDGTISLVMNGC
jgi:hypothetical protein